MGPPFAPLSQRSRRVGQVSTANVTRRLRARGLPVELVRGGGYHYFIFDEGALYATHSVMVPRFRSLPVDRWEAMGADFAGMVRDGTYDPFTSTI